MMNSQAANALPRCFDATATSTIWSSGSSGPTRWMMVTPSSSQRAHAAAQRARTADGATHVGVATDKVIESFRNQLYAGYKTGEGIDPTLYSQFPILEEGLELMGVPVWAMTELEADDALADQAFGLLLLFGGRLRRIAIGIHGTGAVAVTDDEEVLGKLRGIGDDSALGRGRMPRQQGGVQKAPQQGHD